VGVIDYMPYVEWVRKGPAQHGKLTDSF